MNQKTIRIEIPEARDFMNTHVFAFHADTEISVAVKALLHKGYSGAPVVDAGGRLAGVLSEADCVRVLGEAVYDGWPDGSVRDNMSKDVETIAPTTDLFAVLGLFRSGAHRRLPVVDDESRVVGLVTRRDLLRALDDFRNEQEHANALAVRA